MIYLYVLCNWKLKGYQNVNKFWWFILEHHDILVEAWENAISPVPDYCEWCPTTERNYFINYYSFFFYINVTILMYSTLYFFLISIIFFTEKAFKNFLHVMVHVLKRYHVERRLFRRRVLRLR